MSLTEEQNEKGSKGLGSPRHTNPNLSSHSPRPGQLPSGFAESPGYSLSRQGRRETPIGLNCRAIASWLLSSTNLALTWEAYTAPTVIPRPVPRCSAKDRRRYTQKSMGALIAQPTQLERSMASFMEIGTEQPQRRPLRSTVDSGMKDAPREAVVNGGHRGGTSAVSNKGNQPTWSGTEEVPVWWVQAKIAFPDYRKPTYVLVIPKTSTTQTHLLLRYLTLHALYPSRIVRKDMEQHPVVYCQCLPHHLEVRLGPRDLGTDPHCSALISAICCCSPVAQADVKYQLCAEGVPPGRSRALTQGHALNSPLRAGLVKKL